jgi:beta-glucosidase
MPLHPSDLADEAKRLVAQMTLKEKAGFCSGADFWHLKSLERLGLRQIMVSDGPHGLRKQAETSDHLGMGVSVPATCFPAAGTLASAWDPELCQQMGEALAKECAAEDVAVILGPGINIKRNPLCGRNFEYFSEDPLLAGVLAAAFIRGVQSQGVGCSLKHFAANNQETFRMVVDTRVDERTLRELYLPAFERAVTEAQPWTVMCGYNRLNGVWCSDHRWLLTTVLREQWGFRGLVVSDWAGTNDRVAGVTAGMDLEMPSSGGVNDRRVERAVSGGALEEASLDAVAVRVVSLVLAAQRATAARPAPPPSAEARCAPPAAPASLRAAPAR